MKALFSEMIATNWARPTRQDSRSAAQPKDQVRTKTVEAQTSNSPLTKDNAESFNSSKHCAMQDSTTPTREARRPASVRSEMKEERSRLSDQDKQHQASDQEERPNGLKDLDRQYRLNEQDKQRRPSEQDKHHRSKHSHNQNSSLQDRMSSTEVLNLAKLPKQPGLPKEPNKAKSRTGQDPTDDSKAPQSTQYAKAVGQTTPQTPEQHCRPIVDLPSGQAQSRLVLQGACSNITVMEQKRQHKVVSMGEMVGQHKSVNAASPSSNKLLPERPAQVEQIIQHSGKPPSTSRAVDIETARVPATVLKDTAKRDERIKPQQREPPAEKKMMNTAAAKLEVPLTKLDIFVRSWHNLKPGGAFAKPRPSNGPAKNHIDLTRWNLH